MAVMAKIDLAGRWRHVMDGTLAGENRGYFQETFDRSAWRSIGVPSTFAAIDPVLATYDRAAWYARTVQVGWRADGGVLHDVGLIAGDFLHIDRVRVVAEPEAGGGR